MKRLEPDLAHWAVQTKGLTRQFGAFTAVDHLDLQVARGSIFGLLGPNGAGKSTIIKMLTTLLPPTSGDAWIAGYGIREMPAQVRAHIGYVPQLLSADGDLTGYENLLIFAKLYRVPHAQREQRIREILAFMGLADVANEMVRTYSGGMVRRLEIGQSMLHRPAVLFLDEPTTGLDPSARRAVWERIRELRSQMGTTIFMTTHGMDEAEALCGQVAFLHAGRLAKVGAPGELKAAIGPRATLEDVFTQLTGTTIERENYVNVRQERGVASRLE